MTLDPWYVTGIVDGEGCFSLVLNSERKKRKNGTVSVYTYWITVFRISLREDEIDIIRKLHEYFGCGSVCTSTSTLNKKSGLPGTCSLHIKSRQELVRNVILHFEIYCLQAKKKIIYDKWREAVSILNRSDMLRKNKFSKQMISELDMKRLYAIKKEIAEFQSGGRKIIALRSLQRLHGKQVLAKHDRLTI